MNNNVFDKYYDIFGFIFDYLKMNQNNKEAQDNFISECGNKFNENIKELSKLNIYLTNRYLIALFNYLIYLC